jgi:hypothetical protein
MSAQGTARLSRSSPISASCLVPGRPRCGRARRNRPGAWWRPSPGRWRPAPGSNRVQAVPPGTCRSGSWPRTP